MLSKKKYSPTFKLKVIVDVLETGDMPSVARKYGLAHSLVAKWRRRLLEEGHHVFVSTPDKEKAKLQNQIGKLEQMVGKKEVELELLKNFSDFYVSQNGT
jgi:transposase